MESENEKKLGASTPVTVAAGLAILALSVRGNVPELLAASPQDQCKLKQEYASPLLKGEESKRLKVIPSAKQGKVTSLQTKIDRKLQPTKSKLPAVQDKAEELVK